MEEFDRKNHWEHIYQTKKLDEVSWYQSTPATSLKFFEKFDIPKAAKIIDIGGGDSLLVDHLLDLGYQDITVLDISESALERTKLRLGDLAGSVKWIVADLVTFKPNEHYDFWHDRAAFHFLTKEEDIINYLNTVWQYLKPQGILVIGTFSEQGPKKCSGIEIRQYSETSMALRLKDHFEKIECIPVEHKTPFDTLQQYIFCSFRRPD